MAARCLVAVYAMRQRCFSATPYDAALLYADGAAAMSERSERVVVDV